MKKYLYSVLISAALALGGCGGGSDAQDAASASTLDALAAKCVGNGAKRCSTSTSTTDPSATTTTTTDTSTTTTDASTSTSTTTTDSTASTATTTSTAPTTTTTSSTTTTTTTSTAPTMAGLPLGEATVKMTLDGVDFDVYTYKPSSTPKGILLVFHGTNANAADYRRYAEPLANKAGWVVATPLFDEARFGNTKYNRGNVLPGSYPNTWTTRFVPKLIEQMTAREGGLPIYIFGFSAGGQFVSRFTALENLPGVVRVVGGGASTYMLPTRSEAAPYGLGSLPTVDDPYVTRYLAKPYSIIVGSEDNDTSDPNLSTTDAAMRQGTDRLDRAKKTFAFGQNMAQQRGDAFNWDLFIVPGVGHSSSSILRSKELQQAFRLPNPAPL